MQSLTQPIKVEAVPTMNGQYALHERIGQGGMGMVYRGEQLALGRTVAIKLLHPELAAIPELVRRFHVEARAASRLSHRGSVAVYDYGVTSDGAPFIVMEYVAGQTLTRLIRERWPVSMQATVDLAIQILAAVGDAHAAGVIHGDIKSDNVLVETGRDGVDHAKLVDYGLARLVDETGVDEGVCGTPEYMAPEVASGDPATEASDLYSVGSMIYEMLTGAPPFVGADPTAVLQLQVGSPVIPPSIKAPDRKIPRALEAVVMKALEKNPANRYPSAAHFAAALDRARPDDVDEAKRCACGTRIPARAQCCLGCGATVFGMRPPHFLDTPTRSWDATELASTRTRLARGSGAPEAPLDERINQVRELIGTAIARGAVQDIAAGYLELGKLLAGTIGIHAAASELEEGVNVLTGGAGPGAEHPPDHLWELLVELAKLYDQIGDRVRARAFAAHAHLQARSCHSAQGRGQTIALLQELRA